MSEIVLVDKPITKTILLEGRVFIVDNDDDDFQSVNLHDLLRGLSAIRNNPNVPSNDKFIIDCFFK